MAGRIKDWLSLLVPIPDTTGLGACMVVFGALPDDDFLRFLPAFVVLFLTVVSDATGRLSLGWQVYLIFFNVFIQLLSVLFIVL